MEGNFVGVRMFAFSAPSHLSLARWFYDGNADNKVWPIKTAGVVLRDGNAPKWPKDGGGNKKTPLIVDGDDASWRERDEGAISTRGRNKTHYVTRREDR